MANAFYSARLRIHGEIAPVYSYADLASFTSFSSIHVAELSFTAGLVLSRAHSFCMSCLELNNLRSLVLADGEFKSVGTLDFQSE